MYASEKHRSIRIFMIAKGDKRMKKVLVVLLTAVLACSMVFANGASESEAGTWPEGNVNFVVAAKAGGGTDLIARKAAEVAHRITGDNYIVINQKEGNGAVAINTVYSDDEDALNVGFFIPSFFTAYITGTVNQNPITDFKVANYANRETCAYICVKADAKWQTIEELMDDVKNNPNSIVFGTSLGSRSHFRIEEFSQAAGLKWRYVEAGKTADAIAALLGGHIQVTSLSAKSADSYAKNGDIRILACSDKPIVINEVNQNAPTYAELGYTDLKCLDPVIIVTSKKASDETVRQIHDVMYQVFTDQEFLDFMKTNGTIVQAYDYDKSVEWYNETFRLYDEVGAKLGVKAAR